MLTYILDNARRTPLYEQLYTAVRQDIISGTLASGEKLPSKRQLAAHLKISQVTVEAAYGQLVAEGYIESKPKRGYFVQKIEVLRPYPKEKPGEEPIFEKMDETHYRYDFRTDMVDAECFPFSIWARLMRETLTEQAGHLLEATEPQGAAPLREQICRYLYSFRGLHVHPDQVIAGAGSEYLVGLLIGLLGRNTLYALENPGYPKLRKIFGANDARALSIPLDAEGIRVDALRQSGAETVYITPSHHFPLGIVMSASRRAALLQWAQESENRYIIEDDYDSEYRYATKPIPALSGMAQSDKVIYINTFAKSLAPSLRIGYLVLPRPLAKRFREEFGFYASTVPSFDQYTLAKFIETGSFERHISRSRNLYRMRRDLLLEALQKSALAPHIAVTGAEAGIHLLLQLRTGMDEQSMVRRAAAHGVRVYGLSAYYADGNAPVPPATVLLGYAGIGAGDIEAAVDCLVWAWKE